MQHSSDFEDLNQIFAQKSSYNLGKWQTYCFAKILQLPGMAYIFQNTFLGSTYHIKNLIKQNKLSTALQHLLKLLKSDKLLKRQPVRWWYLMRRAIMLVQDYHLCSQSRFKSEIKQLMQLGLNGPLCLKSYDVAFCFVGLGLWAFKMGDVKLAVRYIQHAIDADKTWGYPDYLMGWLGLFDDDVDSVHYFIKALKYNWSFFHRIKSDPICQKHPAVLKEVRQKVLHLNSQGGNIGPKVQNN